MAPKSPKSQQKTKTKAGKFLSGIANKAKTIISRVGAGKQSANALQATTLPGAGNVFTGNTPNQQAKSAREQAIIAPKGKRTVSFGKPKGAPLPAGTTRGNLVNQAISTGNKSSNTSGNVQMRNDAQANNSYGEPIAEGLGGINTSSNQQAGTTTLGRQTVGTPTTSVVNAQDIAGTQRMTFPTVEDTFIPTITPLTPLEQQESALQNESQNNFQSYLNSFAPPPSQEDAYNRAQQQAGTIQKQQVVNELTGKLNSIVAQGQQNQLSVVGQGRGIPEAILGGQQAQFARETAIQALPVQAQLSAAQGDLEAAEQNLNTLFKIYSDDATNKYNYKKGINEAIYKFTDSQTQTKLQALQKKQDREYEQQQADIKTRQSLAIEANKNGASSAVTNAILNAPDIASAIKSMGRWGVNPTEQAIKNLSLKKLQMELDGDDSSGLSQEQKEKIASNPTAKQSVARIGVISAVQDYISKLEKYKGPSGSIDFNRLTRGEKKELQTALKTTVGSAINVAQGQGAMGDAEATRILSDLEPTRWTRTSVFSRAAKGVIDAQNSLLNQELSFLESTFPGVSELSVFKNYKSGVNPSSQSSIPGFSQDEMSILNEAWNQQKQLLPASSYYQ